MKNQEDQLKIYIQVLETHLKVALDALKQIADNLHNDSGEHEMMANIAINALNKLGEK